MSLGDSRLADLVLHLGRCFFLQEEDGIRDSSVTGVQTCALPILFFALGGYSMGMYLMRQIGREGQYQSDLPDFMVFLDWKEFPWQWWNTDQFWWAMLLVVLVPGLLALVFGFFAFR